MRENEIFWSRLDTPGSECARLVEATDQKVFTGNAVFLHEGKCCSLLYTITCDDRWFTRTVRVTGRVGQRGIDVSVDVREGGEWRLNGVSSPQVAGCIDVDLNFSPLTNTLPIRR